jgi:uncharacterized membrane protein
VEVAARPALDGTGKDHATALVHHRSSTLTFQALSYPRKLRRQLEELMFALGKAGPLRGTAAKLPRIAARIAAVCAFMVAAPTARAELRICNQTLNLYNVAVGYFTGAGCHKTPVDEATCRMQTEGWWNLPASGCVPLIKYELEETFYYIFATDIYGDDAVTGDTELCVKLNRKFEIQIPFAETSAKAPGCWQKGYQQVKFKEIDTHNAKDWTVFVGQGTGGE